MAHTVIWYGKQGKKTPFDAEKAARDHAPETFADRSGIVAVEVPKDDGTVVFSKAGATSASNST